MVKRISYRIDYSYFPFTNIRIGREKVDYFDDKSEKKIFYGLNKIIHEIIHEIKRLAGRT